MRNILQLCLMLLILTGCAVPAPFVKVTPSTIENKDYWDMGQQFVFANNKNVWFDCAFNRIENGKLIFDVKVNNQSDTAILVDPARFLQMVYKDDTIKSGEHYAYDPEETLMLLRLDENAANAKAKNATAFGICSAIIAVGATVAVVSSKKDDETKAKVVNTIGVASDLVQTATALTVDASNIRAENNWTVRKSLDEQFLRKTTLPKGYFIDGEVHFPYVAEAKWYNIIFEAGKSKADFLFKQKLIYPPTTSH